MLYIICSRCSYCSDSDFLSDLIYPFVSDNGKKIGIGKKKSDGQCEQTVRDVATYCVHHVTLLPDNRCFCFSCIDQGDRDVASCILVQCNYCAGFMHEI